jgi:hypothetical protein
MAIEGHLEEQQDIYKDAIKHQDHNDYVSKYILADAF